MIELIGFLQLTRRSKFSWIISQQTFPGEICNWTKDDNRARKTGMLKRDSLIRRKL